MVAAPERERRRRPEERRVWMGSARCGRGAMQVRSTAVTMLLLRQQQMVMVLMMIMMPQHAPEDTRALLCVGGVVKHGGTEITSAC